MNNGNISKKHNGKLRLALFIIVIYLVILAYLSIKPSGMARVVYGSVKSDYDTEGMIIRDEKVVYSPKSGYIVKKIEENTRVPKGLEVIRMNSKESIGDLSSQLDEINEKIKIAESENNTNFADDINKMDVEITGQLFDIKTEAKTGAFVSTRKNIDNLTSMLEKKNIIAANNPFTKDNLSKLKSEKKEIEDMINSSYSYANSPEAGIVSFNIDGYESVNVNNVADHNVFNSKPRNVSAGNDENFVKTGDPLFKVIDNYQWYIYIKVPSKELTLKEGEKIKLNIKGNELNAKVTKAIHKDDGYYALLQLTEQYNDFVEDRFIKLQIIKNFGEGMMLPRESVVSENGKSYVYKYDAGKLKKIEVKVLAEDGDKTIVESVDKLNGLKIYDEVVNDKGVISKNINTEE